MPAASTEAKDQGQQHLIVPTAPAAAPDLNEARERCGQTQVLDQAGTKAAHQASLFFVGDTELRFTGRVERHVGCGSKRANSVTHGVKIPQGKNDCLNCLTGTTFLLASDPLIRELRLSSALRSASEAASAANTACRICSSAAPAMLAAIRRQELERIVASDTGLQTRQIQKPGHPEPLPDSISHRQTTALLETYRSTCQDSSCPP